MKILGRYVFREIFVSSLLATTLATFIIFLRFVPALIQLLLRSNDGKVFLLLCLYSLPPVLVLSIPFGVLVGILIGLGRMSGDNELVAIRSGGVSSQVVAPPVIIFSVIAMLISGACALWLNPLAIRSAVRLENRVGASLSADIVPQVFQEQFTNDNTVLYVDDKENSVGPEVLKRVFIADISPPSERKSPTKDQPIGPKITIAKEAIAVPDPKNGRMQLTMSDVSTHEPPFHTIAPTGSIILMQNSQEEKKAKKYQDMFTPELQAYIRGVPRKSQESVDARIELHRRLALPFACLMLALVGIPLGASSRKGGRSAGYVWGIFLAFLCYYLGYSTLISLASRSHSLSAEVASWLPNALFCFAGIVLIIRMETPGDRDLIGAVRGTVQGWFKLLSRRFERKQTVAKPQTTGMRIVLFQIMDSYVLSTFLFYFILWLGAFLTMEQVFTFFDLLGDVTQHHVPLSHVVKYHVFLTPYFIYQTLPITVLLAVLVTFGVMTKSNEVTAFKACGISVRRLSMPVLLMSGVLSAGLFAADFDWIPHANQIQDELLNEIKGRPIQTYLHPERKWIIDDYRIFYVRGFDTAEQMMIEPYVFELDPKTFHLVRWINANRARYQPSIKQWVWEQGTARDICGIHECAHTDFQVTTFPEIAEVPKDFKIEAKQNQQMNYMELGDYIRYLQHRGFDTQRLQVQYYEKFSVPVFGFIMALISVPFGFMVGNRGAMAGIGVSIGIAVVYLGIGRLFEQMGNVNYLPAELAAWSPDALFALGGLYLLLRMKS